MAEAATAAVIPTVVGLKAVQGMAQMALTAEEATAVTRQRPYTAGCKSEHRLVCFDKPAGTR